MNCHAIRVGDQMMCGVCTLQWDANDPEPPACNYNENYNEPGNVEYSGVPVYNFDGNTTRIGVTDAPSDIEVPGKMALFNGDYTMAVPPGLMRTDKGYVAIQHSIHNTMVRFTHFNTKGKRVEEIEVISRNGVNIARNRRSPKDHFWTSWKPFKIN